LKTAIKHTTARFAMAHHKLQQGLHTWAAAHHANPKRGDEKGHDAKFHDQAKHYHHEKSKQYAAAHDKLVHQWKSPNKSNDAFDKKENSDTAMQRQANYSGSQPGVTAAL
jgi:hypothetical protein